MLFSCRIFANSGLSLPISSIVGYIRYAYRRIQCNAMLQTLSFNPFGTTAGQFIGDLSQHHEIIHFDHNRVDITDHDKNYMI